MPRQAHGRPVMQASDPVHGQQGKRSKRREAGRQRGRGLDALQIAERELPEELGGRMKGRLALNADEDEASDVDERPSKRKRKNEDDGDEDYDGSDHDSEQWHVMGEGANGEEEDEDSEIESEDAFGSSDDERFEGWRFAGSTGGKKAGSKRHAGEADEEAEEDDEDDDESLGDEAVDLATAWDMDDQDQLEEKERQEKKRAKHEIRGEVDNAGSTSDDDESAEEDDEDEDDDDAESDLYVSDQEDGDHARLQSFVHSLSRKPDASTISSEAQKQTAAISASDLLQYVNDPTQRQSLKVLQSTERKGAEEYKGGIPGRLAAPLPKRQQDRLDRSAAYEESKKELGKWVDTVKQNRRAEHLQFPLVDPNDPVAHSNRQLPEIQGKPMTELERKVQEIMAESGIVNEDDEMQREEEGLAEQKVSLEEIQARRAEMRRQRDLLFREEVKARRIKKIKSKAYRRIHRKERAKLEAEKRAEDVLRGEVDSDEERERQERIRAEERMGRRHRESKWAKGAKEIGRGKWDDGARAAMEDMARRDDDLRRRVEGRERDNDSLVSDESSSDSDSEDEDQALEAKLLNLKKQTSDGATSKLGSMAFMQRAEAAAKARNEAEIQEIRRQLHDAGNGDVDDDDSDTDLAQSAGRQQFGVKTGQASTHPPRPAPETSEFEERLSESDEEAGNEAGNDDHREAVSTRPAPQHSQRSEPPAKPLSTVLTTSTKQAAVVNGTRQHKQQSLIKPAKPHETALDDYTSPSGSDSEEDEPVTAQGNAATALTLADDVFAGDDDVIKEFQREKREIIREEGDQIVDNGLPGWGAWTGAGISKKAQKRTKNKFLTTTKGVAPEKRQDAKLEKVIVNEKRVKKNGKYLATELPHPFESRQQYERSLRLPLGPEWTTKSTFQDATKPRVLVKQGVIRAIQRPQI